MNSESFFETSIFSPAIEFSRAAEADSATLRQEGRSSQGRLLIRIRAMGFAAATLLVCQSTTNQSKILHPNAAVEEQLQCTPTDVSAGPSVLFASDLNAIRQARPLARSADLEELARQAVSRLQSRQDEKVDSWAEALAG